MLARDVGLLLKEKGLTVSVAESCTGGKLGDILTSVPGSSDYFLGGVISYSNEAKMQLLGVSREDLRTKGAVSEEVALEMASGVRKALRSSIGIGITGIAGPTGATPGKPVGMVYIAVGSEKSRICAKHLFRGSRSAVKRRAAMKALEMLKDFLEGQRKP